MLDVRCCPPPLATRHLPQCLLLLLAAFSLLAPGCATQNVNPPQARANTGYVDFRADPAEELCWQIERFDDRAQSFKKVFSELDPPSGGFLRLAFAPGHNQLRVSFMNRVIVQPVEIGVAVQEGKVTPVRVTLTPTGTTQVKTREVSRGATAKGRYGRRTEFGSDETAMYSLSALADPPVAYEPKEQMPYAH
jgi:hypothetical protein